MMWKLFSIALWPLTAATGLPQESNRLFKKWDKNSDGQLTQSELPERLRGNFRRADTDQDGYISMKEHQEFTANRLRPGRIPENVRALRDIPYVESGHERQKLDIYLPKQTTPELMPLVIWIHGGGWKSGNRFPCPALWLTQKGFVVASLGYRLSGSAVFPAQIHDCKAAIRHLRANAMQYRIDENHIGVWGSSAGGHLVALVGTTGNTSELDGNVGMHAPTSSRVQAVCDYYGPTDLLRMADQAGPNSKLDHDAKDSPESKLLGGPLQSKQQLARQANPITYVDPEDPPFLIVHGSADPLVPLGQSKLLNDSLQSSGVDTQLIVVPGGGHGPFRQPEQLNQVADFFRLHLQH